MGTRNFNRVAVELLAVERRSRRFRNESDRMRTRLPGSKAHGDRALRLRRESPACVVADGKIASVSSFESKTDRRNRCLAGVREANSGHRRCVDLGTELKGHS